MTYNMYNFKHSIVFYGHQEKGHNFYIAADWYSNFLSIKTNQQTGN